MCAVNVLAGSMVAVTTLCPSLSETRQDCLADGRLIFPLEVRQPRLLCTVNGHVVLHFAGLSNGCTYLGTDYGYGVKCA